MSNDVADRISAIIKSALAVSSVSQGREVYVKLTDLHEVVARLQALKTKVVNAERAAADADAKVCPLAIGDPHTPCVLAGVADERADHAENDAAAMHAVLFEMFREGPVKIAMAGNPLAIESLSERTFAAIETYEARIQREHEAAA